MGRRVARYPWTLLAVKWAPQRLVRGPTTPFYSRHALHALRGPGGARASDT